MWLTNIGDVRIHHYTKGWVVEIQKKTWYGKKYWIHLISVAGLYEYPYYFKSFNSALKEAIKYFKWDLMEGSQD